MKKKVLCFEKLSSNRCLFHPPTVSKPFKNDRPVRYLQNMII
jgi:hypothetical protein